MRGEAVDTARYEGGATQPIHRSLHDRCIVENVLTRLPFRYASHQKILAWDPTGRCNRRGDQRDRSEAIFAGRIEPPGHANSKRPFWGSSESSESSERKFETPTPARR
jgi:hypothetical protein